MLRTKDGAAVGAWPQGLRKWQETSFWSCFSVAAATYPKLGRRLCPLQPSHAPYPSSFPLSHQSPALGTPFSHAMRWPTILLLGRGSGQCSASAQESSPGSGANSNHGCILPPSSQDGPSTGHTRLVQRSTQVHVPTT